MTSLLAIRSQLFVNRRATLHGSGTTSFRASHTCAFGGAVAAGYRRQPEQGMKREGSSPSL